jgi:cholesterol transport system auxiliary component
MKRGFCAVALSLALGACSLGVGNKAPPFLLNLTPAETPGPSDGRILGADDAMTVGVPLVPQAIASTRVPVAQNGSAIAYIKDAVWVEQPARLFQRLLAETIRLKTGRAVLDPRQFSMEPGTLLSGHLLRFDIDEASGNAIVVYDATLSGAKDRPVRTRRFEARVPAGSIEAEGVGRALNQAANKVAADVAAWVGS